LQNLQVSYAALEYKEPQSQGRFGAVFFVNIQIAAAANTYDGKCLPGLLPDKKPRKLGRTLAIARCCFLNRRATGCAAMLVAWPGKESL
jgi:hypothetical protein